MTPHEFIKSGGVSIAKKYLLTEPLPDEHNFYKELGTLIYYFASVQELGGVEAAKKYMDSPYTAPEIKAFLAQALAEMEKCQ